MLSFMGENKRLLNIHEHKFDELVAFQTNKNVFQANTNASLKNLETQVGQLALAMQNQSKDAFPSDSKKNPKDCMVVTLRSGREMKEREENEKRMAEIEKHVEIGEDIKQNYSEVTERERIIKLQQKQPVEEGNLRKKNEVQAYKPPVPFPQRLQKAKLEEKFSKFLTMVKKIKIKIPFSEALIQMFSMLSS